MPTQPPSPALDAAWREAVFLLSMSIRGRYHRAATCFAVSPRRLVTSAHAVYDHRTGGFFERIRVQHVDPDTQRLRWTLEVSPQRLTVPAAYIEDDERVGSDYATIDLEAPLPGGRFFGPCAAPDALLRSTLVTASGYPGEDRLTVAAGPVAAEPDQLHYDHFGGVGASGSPLWICGSAGQKLVVGIHSRTHRGAVKAAARVTDAVRCTLWG